MTELQKVVYLAPNNKEPFTTSQDISDCVGLTHDAVQKLITRHMDDFKSFGKVGFEIRKMDGRGRPKKVYHLNEQQATLLMTYLKNTEVVRKFKMELVRQFYAMRRELEKCGVIKVDRKAIRRNVTDAIKALPETPHKKFKYAQYTNLVYLTAIGKTAKAIKAERGAKPTDTASDYLTSDELASVVDVENRVGVLIEAGFDYQTIKAALQKRLTAKEAS